MDSDMNAFDDLLIESEQRDNDDIEGAEEIFIDIIDPLAAPKASSQKDNKTSEGVDQLKLPCFKITNVVFEAELPYILSENGLPAYFYNDNFYKPLGKMRADLDNILRARFLDMKISFINKDGIEESLEETENLLQFITIPSDFINDMEELGWVS